MITDAGHKATDAILKKIEQEVMETYARALKETRAKLNAYMARYKRMDAEKLKMVNEGKLSRDDYIKWRINRIGEGGRWRRMVDVLATDLTNADEIAMSIVNGHTPEAYAINMNYGMYQVESGLGINTGFTLYDRSTVERLIRDKPNLLPKPKVDIPKDQRWNKTHIVNEVTQGILQGESIDKISNRLQNVVGMDETAAMRNARTAVTGAQNAGRVDAYKRAEDMGIEVKQEWVAVHDHRTRESHAALDGEQVAMGEKFSNGCRYPGDPECDDPSEVYNCRCTLVPVLGVLGQIKDQDTDESIKDSDYDEWTAKHGKQNGE